MYYMLPIYPWVPKSLPRFDLWHLPQPAQALAAIEQQGTPYAWAAGGSHSRNRVGNQITYIYIYTQYLERSRCHFIYDINLEDNVFFVKKIVFTDVSKLNQGHSLS